MKKNPRTPKEIVVIVISAVLLVASIILLGLWTKALTREERSNMLRLALSELVEEEGERGLLEAAGVPVDDIHYSYEDLPLFAGDRPVWEFTDEETRSAAIYQKTAPSVVQIVSASELSDAGQGAGVIISGDGYIATNRHVAGSSSSFIIRFYDGSTATASLVGSDPLLDIAVLKADKAGLDDIDVGSSKDLGIGASVFAIGHPYGYTWSMTKGIVSGLERMVFSDSGLVIPSLIQTDAIINPGNSGGPLVSSSGLMVGLVSSIYSRSGSAEGISFAIPAERVMASAEAIIETGSVHRGWLDILSVELNEQIADYSSLDVRKGILVSQVVPGGNADKGGIRGGREAVQYGQSVIYLGGDVITAINGRKIESYEDYFAVLFDTVPGETADVTVIRNGREITLKGVTLSEQTEDNSRWLIR